LRQTEIKINNKL